MFSNRNYSRRPVPPRTNKGSFRGRRKSVPGGFEQNIHVLHAPGKTLYSRVAALVVRRCIRIMPTNLKTGSRVP